MSTATLQERLDRLGDGLPFKLDPAGREFEGPLVIRKPVVVEGQGGTIYTRLGPTLTIESPGVVLRNLNLEITYRNAPPDGEGGCALLVSPGLPVIMEKVAVRGNVLGLEHEEGVWSCPRSLPLGSLRAGTPHKFKVRIRAAAPCSLESQIDGLTIRPSKLDAGLTTVTLELDAMPIGTLLRGLVLIQTQQLTRRLPVSGLFGTEGVVGQGQLLWPLEDATPTNDKEDLDLHLEMIQPSNPDYVEPNLVAIDEGKARTNTTAAVVRPGAGDSEKPSADAKFIVSPVDVGSYRTIGEALRAAPPGARIVVRPGIYKESLTITKAVEIVADGSVAEVVVEADGGNCLLIQADTATVRGLTLRLAVGRGGRGRYCVSVPRGKLTLEDCTITSNSLACVAALGSSASPVLHGCTIFGGASAGVLVADKAEAFLQDCGIHGHATAGVESRRGGHATLRNCAISECKQVGVLVHDNAKATLEDCQIHDNALSGIEARQAGHSKLKNCAISENGGPGVRIHEGALAVLEDCDLFENTLANLEVRHSGNPLLRRCRLRDGKAAGALFAREAKGVLEDCHIEGNAHAAVEIRQHANPTLRRCTCTTPGDVCVAVRDHGGGILEECDLSKAGLAVVEIRQSSSPVLKRCKIHDSRAAGVLTANHGAGVLEECEIFANQGPGVAACGESNPTLRRCQVNDNQQAGIAAWDNGNVTLERCEIFGNWLAGLAVLEGASVTTRNCKVTRNQDAGVWARRGANGIVEDCDLIGNGEGSFDLEAGAGLQLGKNRVDP